jgi:SGNH hydrolase-like domain, acetyltransferase AlgX
MRSWIAPTLFLCTCGGCRDASDAAARPNDSRSTASPATERRPVDAAPAVKAGADEHAAEALDAERRAADICHDTDMLRNECQQAADGDWQKWRANTAVYRDALKARIKACTRPDGIPHVLEGDDEFPLFVADPTDRLRHVYDDAAMDGFLVNSPVVAARRWLAQRGIDLIVVPVPEMGEIYVEPFVQPCPADGIVAPHLRRTLYELLQADVETVDAFSLFRSKRQPDPEYLYNTADCHWAPKAQRVMAAELARRIARYGFGARAQAARARVRVSREPYNICAGPEWLKPGELPRMESWSLLNAGQKERAARVQTRFQDRVTMADGSEPADDYRSPVLLIGNSFVVGFRGQLIRALNMRIRTNWRGCHTTEAFADFLREPEQLQGVRVVIWVTIERHLRKRNLMPESIMAELATPKS